MTDADDFVRSFGMSGFLICDELRQIEQRFGIELGHVPKAEVGSAVAYYPQFEQAVRLEAASMSENYEVFYCLEQAIRKLIVETLEGRRRSGLVEQRSHSARHQGGCSQPDKKRA